MVYFRALSWYQIVLRRSATRRFQNCYLARALSTLSYFPGGSLFIWALHLEIIRNLLKKLPLKGVFDQGRALWGCFGKFGIVFYVGDLLWDLDLETTQKGNPPSGGGFFRSKSRWVVVNQLRRTRCRDHVVVLSCGEDFLCFFVSWEARTQRQCNYWTKWVVFTQNKLSWAVTDLIYGLLTSA